MKKILLTTILLKIISSAHADISLNENIYTGCRVDSLGVMAGCQTRQETITNITSFSTRPDIKLHDVFNYSYTCEDNFLTNIEIVSSDGSSVGKFQYNGGTFENDVNGILSIKDFDSFTTGRAKYNKSCQLSLTSITQDLAKGSVFILSKDVCSMDLLNNIISQTKTILSLTAGIINNLTQLNAEMTSLIIDLENLKSQVTDPQAKATIDNIIGDDNSKDGSVNYIMKNSSSWGQSSQILIDNLNLLYSNIQSAVTYLNEQTIKSSNNIYSSDIQIISHKEFPASSELLNSFNYEYLRLQGQDTSSYTAPVCQ